MSDRTISVTLDLVDNVTGPLKDIMGSMDDVQTPIDVTVDTGNSKKEVGEVTKSVKETGKEADNSGKHGKNAFLSFSESAKTAYSSVMDLVGGVIALGAGAYGLTTLYMSAAKSKLYADQMGTAIEANKALKISQKELQDAAKGMDWTTTTKGMELLYNTISAANGALGTGQKALKGATNISKFFESRQESMQANGFGDTTQLMRMATMSEGAMSGRMRSKFQAATGFNDKEMATSKSRVKAMAEKGLTVNMDDQQLLRPWDEIEEALSRIKKSIGESIAGPMSKIFGIIVTILDVINKIPGSGWLIALAIGAATLTAALMVVVTAYNMLVTAQTLAAASAVKALLLNGGLITTFTGLAASAWAAAAGVWAFMAPILPFIAAGAAIVGVLYLINEKTGIFSKLIALATNGLGTLWDMMKASTGFKVVASLFGVDSKKLVDGVDDLNSTTDKGTSIWTKILDTLQSIWDWFKSFFGGGSVTSGIAGALETVLPSGLKEGIDAFLGKTKAASGPGATIATGVIDTATGGGGSGNTGAGATAITSGVTPGTIGGPVIDTGYGVPDAGFHDPKGYMLNGELMSAENMNILAAKANTADRAVMAKNAKPMSGSSEKSSGGSSSGSSKSTSSTSHAERTAKSKSANRGFTKSTGQTSLFASGTPFVPEDMVALIHKGERVVPASQNRAGMGGSVVNNISLGGISLTHTGGAAEDARLVRLIESTIKKVVKPMGRT